MFFPRRGYSTQGKQFPSCLLCLALFTSSILGQLQVAMGGERELKNSSSLNDRQKLTERLLESVKARLDQPQLNELFYRSDPSTSFTAFWIRIVQQPGTPPATTLVNMGRFIGLIEKALGVSVPAWWIDILNRSERGASAFPSPISYHRVDYGNGLQTYQARHYRIRDHEIVNKTSEKRSAAALETFLTEFQGEFKYIECAEAGDLLICAFSSDRAMSYPLVAFDLKRGKIAWKATVWAGAYTAGSGLASHFIELVIAGDEAIVFGSDSGCLYLESFKVKDGAASCRFNSSLWGSRQSSER